ncbi:MAG: hypothetical protein GX224_00295 [Thermoplasmatales archaeon]|nr:hypothetical protein [Thermoplasmatales archaeon]
MAKTAIMIAAHGSISKNNESAAELQAKLLSEKGFENVYPCYKGYTKPYIQDTLAELDAKGFGRIVVVPLFMAPGYYSDKVLPKRLGLPEGVKEGTSPGGAKIVVTDPIGIHPMAAKIALDEALSLSEGNGRKGVLFIGHGSKSPDAIAMVMGNVVSAREWHPHVYGAFNEFNEPTVEAALKTMAADGMDEVLAVPLFVSSGGHTEDDLPGKLGLSTPTAGNVTVAGRAMDVRYGRPFGEIPATSAILEAMLGEHSLP